MMFTLNNTSANVLHMPKHAPIEFTEWFKLEFEKSGLGVRAFADKAGLSPATITTLKDGAMPGVDACNGIGQALKIDGYLIAIRAGLFPKPTALSVGVEELASIANKLPDYEIEDLKDNARSKSKRYEKRGNPKTQENR